MGLPYLILTDAGCDSWQEVLTSSGLSVELDAAEVARCEANGEKIELDDHPRLISQRPFRISLGKTVIKCIETKERSGEASLVFVPQGGSEAKVLLQRLTDTLISSGAAVEQAHSTR